MQYKAISADGHINEPPDLWVKNLPEKYRDRGPHVIETKKTKGHAWTMEGQSRPSVMGFSSMYFKSSGKRFDRASLIEQFKQMKNRGVRYEDLFPGSYDPHERVKEIIEDKIDAEVIFNGVGTVWNGIKLMPDKDLSLACFKVYNDWMVEFQEAAPERFRCNATLPTTGLNDCIEELERCYEMGLRTVQLEAYPTGSFHEPTLEDDAFWARAVEMDIPVNVHTMFFFPYGDLGSKITAEGVADSKVKAQSRGIDLNAGTFPMIMWRMIQSGVFERHPKLKLVGSEVQCGWMPYYIEKFDESVKRNRADWDLPMLPSEYFDRNVWLVYIEDELGAIDRYNIGVDKIMWGPDFPHSSSAWPVDYELGLEILQRAGATASEIERIMWKNCADVFNIPYDDPKTISVAA
jgi:predicted TIM-barrel fold metal-dependent hydrolase